LQVAGSGIVNTLAHTRLWDGMYSHVIPNEANGAEAIWLLAAVGQRMDLGDALNVAHRIDRPLVLTYGVGDEVVPNVSTLALAELAHVPLLNDVLQGQDVDHLQYAGVAHPRNTPLRGSGLLQLRIRRTGLVPLDMETHLTFMDGSAQEILRNLFGQLP
jgi:hypothetical protein